MPQNKNFSWVRFILVVLGVIGVWKVFAVPLIPTSDVGLVFGFLHGFYLIIHEAGHVLFSPRLLFFLPDHFGIQWMQLGGSAFQVMVPGILAASAWLKGHKGSAALALMLTGGSLVDVSIYMVDSIPRVLPLLHDNQEGHDWYNLFSQWEISHVSR